VKTVIIDGKTVVEDQRVLTLDEMEILEKAQERAEGVLRKAGVEVKPKWPVL
jgi:hypothetical protein